MLRVIEYFTKSLKVDNGVTLKYGLGVISGSLKMAPFDRSRTSSLHSNYRIARLVSILYYF